ncbi:MAG: hypothetical protein M0R75_01030 [Dehalococcoidia bacterium]|nr:hypothetical protein [Dehalococcoidia bacterium]
MPPLLTDTLSRLRRLAMLDDRVYDELRYESSATLPAVGVTVVGLLALGLGGWLWWFVSDLGDTGSVFLKTVLLGTIFGFVGWLVWLLIVYLALRQLAGITVQVEQLIRTAGFASGVLVIGLAMVITPIGFGIGVLALVAWAGATHIAIERTVGRGGSVVMAANLLGFAAWLVVMSLLSTGTNQIGPGPFLAEAVWDAINGISVTLSGIS